VKWLPRNALREGNFFQFGFIPLAPGSQAVEIRRMETEADNPGSVTRRLRKALRYDRLSPAVRRILSGIVGGVLLLIGIALLFLPGPAFVIIPLGLAVLAMEFAWARRYWGKIRGWVEKARRRAPQIFRTG
jgi:tellurite resistance protein TerC